MKNKNIIKKKLAKLIYKNIIIPIANGKKANKNIYKGVYKYFPINSEF